MHCLRGPAWLWTDSTPPADRPHGHAWAPKGDRGARRLPSEDSGRERGAVGHDAGTRGGASRENRSLQARGKRGPAPPAAAPGPARPPARCCSASAPLPVSQTEPPLIVVDLPGFLMSVFKRRKAPSGHCSPGPTPFSRWRRRLAPFRVVLIHSFCSKRVLEPLSPRDSRLPRRPHRPALRSGRRTGDVARRPFEHVGSPFSACRVVYFHK